MQKDLFHGLCKCGMVWMHCNHIFILRVYICIKLNMPNYVVILLSNVKNLYIFILFMLTVDSFI